MEARQKSDCPPYRTVVLSDYAYEGFIVTLHDGAWGQGNYEVYRQLMDGLGVTAERLGW